MKDYPPPPSFPLFNYQIWKYRKLYNYMITKYSNDIINRFILHLRSRLQFHIYYLFRILFY